MCVKEPAIRSLADQEEDPPESTGRKLKLREIKTLERQEERALAGKRKKKKKDDGDDDDDDEDDDDLDDSDEDMSDTEDPFLQAVGGADKLLTGDAYQNMLLQREQRSMQTDISTDMAT